MKILKIAQDILEMDGEHLASNMKNVPKSTGLRMVAFGSSEFRSKVVGSMLGALNIPFYHRNGRASGSAEENSPDIDIVHLFRSFSVQHGKTSDEYAHFVTCSEHTRPGYVRIVHRTYSPELFTGALVTVDGKTYLSSERVKAIFNEIRAFQGNSGPAMKGEDLGFDIDFVPCLLCDSFPPEASDWIGRSRLRGWPPPKVVERIARTGCGLVAYGHRESNFRHVEWRISFADYEQRLIATLTGCQKQCYVVFKTLVKYVTSPQTGVSSYCLLNTMFWFMERMPERVWNDDFSIASCFKSLLDLFIYYLVNRYLPHYFIPDSNLIAAVPREHIRRILRCLLRLRTKTASVVGEFTSRYSFRDMFPDDGVLQPFFDRLKFDDSLASQIDNLNTYFRLCLGQNQVEGALATVDKCCTLKRLAGDEVSRYDYLERMRISIANATRAEVECRADELASLAAIYFLLYLTEAKDENWQKTIGNAFDLFIMAENGCMSNASRIYYGAFLYKTGNCASALELLNPILATPGGGSVFHFFRLLGKSYCFSLALVIAEAVHLDLTTQQMAYYVSIQCCLKSELAELAEKLMNEFRELCWQSSDHCLWLGYTYGQLFGEFDLAVSCLYRAAEFDAEDFMSTCRKQCYCQMVELWKRDKCNVHIDDSTWLHIGLEGRAKDRLGKPLSRK